MAIKIRTKLFHRRNQEVSLPHVGVVTFDVNGEVLLDETPEAQELAAREDLHTLGLEVVPEDETTALGGELPTDPEELKKAFLSMKMDDVKQMLALAGHPESEFKHLKQASLAEYAVSKLRKEQAAE